MTGGLPFDPRIPLIPLAIMLFGLACSIDLTFVSASISNDSNRMLDQLWFATDGQNGSGSYYYTSLIFHSIPGSLLFFLVFLFGTVHILIIFGRNAHPATLLLCLIVVLPVMFFLSRPAKETVLSPVTFILLGLLCLRLNGFVRVLAVAACYLVYAYFMREYFVIIVAAFLALMILAHVSWSLRSIFVAAALVGLSFAPTWLFETLQGTRDFINTLRFATQTVGAHSAFMNPLPPDSLGNFLINYGYAFLRLNLPVLFQLRMKEVFLLTVALTTLWLVWYGARAGGPKERACALLALAHMMTLNLFEPDLGSYMRHLTSATIYLAPVLALLDRRLLDRAPSAPASAGLAAPQEARP